MRTLACAEGGLLGAAILAGVGAGWYPDAASGAEQVIRPAGQWDPRPEAASVYDRSFATFCAVHDALEGMWPRWCGAP